MFPYTIQEDREEGDERTAVLQALTAAKQKNAELLQELKKFADNDPQVLKMAATDTQVILFITNKYNIYIYAAAITVFCFRLL